MKTEGVLLIDKNIGMTSFDLVANLRPILNTTRVGHCGTLDPMATGLVVMCYGKATKLTRFLSTESKHYIARIKLGVNTATYDRYGPEIEQQPVSDIDIELLKTALDEFTGECEQTVPPYSALKFKGKRLYKYARANKDVPVKSRVVTIHSIELLDFVSPFVTVDIICSRGTYIRSIAHDLGERLGCGATLFDLRRTESGGFHVDDAMTLVQVKARQSMGLLEEKILDASNVLFYPSLQVSDAKRNRISDGIELWADDIDSISEAFSVGDKVSLKDRDGKLLAVAKALVESASLSKIDPVDVPILKYLRVI